MKTTLKHHSQLYEQLSSSCSSIRRELSEFMSAMAHGTCQSESCGAFWRQISQYMESLHEYFTNKQLLKLTKVTHQEFCDALECVDFVREILNILFSIMDYSQWIKEDRFIATITVDGPDKFMQLMQKLKKSQLVSGAELSWFEQRWQQKRNSSLNSSSCGGSHCSGHHQRDHYQKRNARNGSNGRRKSSAGSAQTSAQKHKTQQSRSHTQTMIGAPPTEHRKRSGSSAQQQHQSRPNAWHTNSTSTAANSSQKQQSQSATFSTTKNSVQSDQKPFTNTNSQSSHTFRETSPNMPLSEITQRSSNQANKQHNKATPSENGTSNQSHRSFSGNNTFNSNGHKKSNKKRNKQQFYPGASFPSTSQHIKGHSQQHGHQLHHKHLPNRAVGAPPSYFCHPHQQHTASLAYYVSPSVYSAPHHHYLQHPLHGAIPSHVLDTSHQEISSYAQYNDFTSDYPSDEDSLLNRSGSSDDVEFILTPLSTSNRNPF